MRITAKAVISFVQTKIENFENGRIASTNIVRLWEL